MRIYNLKKDPIDERDYKFSKYIKIATAVELPTKVDLRADMPAIYDQGSLGSCTANAGCANKVYLTGDKALELSRLFLYYKERELHNAIDEDEGAYMRDICKVLSKQGCCEESYFPYVTSTYKHKPTDEAVANALNYTITSYHSIDTLDEIKQALALEQPVLIGIKIYSGFDGKTARNTGVIPMPKSGQKSKGGHAVLIVGYDDENQWLIVRNSWGEDWGDEGYFYLPYAYICKKYVQDIWVILDERIDEDMSYKIIDGQVTPHFSLSEMQCKSGNHEVLINYEALQHAFRVEKFRVWYNRAFVPNSWYRTEEYNKQIGGEDNSFHIKGLATDIPYPSDYDSFTSERKAEFLNNIKAKWLELCQADGLGGGIGWYDTFFHIDSRPIGEYANGTYAFWDNRTK